jgi:hypothetical protein
VPDADPDALSLARLVLRAPDEPTADTLCSLW